MVQVAERREVWTRQRGGERIVSTSTMTGDRSKDEDEKPLVDDQTLVKRSQAGDINAFEELVTRYHGKLYGLLYNMTSNKEDTHDLLQEVFAKAYRSLRHFRGKSTFYTWIYSIATNMTLNFLKKRGRRRGLSLDDADSGIQNDTSFVDQGHRANPRRQSNIHELQKKLNEALQALSEDHRAVVTMFDIQGMPHAEISKILGVSEGTVRSRLYYAHQQLQGHLEDFWKR